MKRKSFITLALACVLLLCLGFSTSAMLKNTTASASETQDKMLAYTVSCFNGDGVAKGTLGATPWDAMKAKGCKYAAVNIIFNSDARYITVAFNEAISAEDYSSIDFGMNFYGGSTVKNNAAKAQIYKPALKDGKVSGTERSETDVEVNAGWYIDSSNGQAGEMNVEVSNVSIPTEALKQDDGKVYGFTIRCVAEATSGAHYAIMSDIVAKANKETDKDAETSEVSVVYDFDGTQVYGKYSNGAADKTHQNIDLHYSADNGPGNHNVFAGDGSTQIAFTGGGGVAVDGWVRIEFAKKVKAEDFPRMVLRYCAGNWAGETITRMYKLSDAGFTTVVEELETAYGNTCASWAIDSAKIADTDGYVRGFMLKRDYTVEGHAGQCFFDYVQFLIEADIPKYEVSEVFIEKDVTEVMPVGNGFSFELKAEQFASEHIEAALETVAYDVLNANLTVTYTDNYSFYFLMKATSAESHYGDSGIMFWFANDNITIGSIKEGKRNIASVKATDKPEVCFASGTAVNVKMSAIPTYLEGDHVGYTLNVYINGAEESVLTLYVAKGDIAIGGYTNIVTQDLDHDFAVTVETAGETAYSANDLMKVEIATSTGKTEYTKDKAILNTNHFEVAGETVSDVKVEGDATYNAETGVLTFTKAGKVKVSYSVTNAFGTFESNVLELTYDDGTKESAPTQKVGCFSSVAGLGGLTALLLLLGVATALKKKEN